jgi:ligand-binding SRPBCC domain-containing protein
MYTISDTVHVNAPIDRCFLLSTNIELVRETLGMRPISGRTTGLIGPNDRITWYGWKFGLPQIHESQITAYERPSFFQDTMSRGKFKRFQHDHVLADIGGFTTLNDRIRFSLPLGFIGDIVAKRLMVPYISRLTRRRLRLIKRIAESDEWRKYLPDEPLVS